MATVLLASLTVTDEMDGTTVGGTITCQSYNGGTLTGTRTCTVTLNVPATVVPSISSVTVEDTVTTVANRIGAFVKSLSKLSVAITAAGTNGSTVSSYRTSLDGVTSVSYTHLQMIEKVNPAHPDKIADRIAGALVDYAYSVQSNPRIAVEALIGHRAVSYTHLIAWLAGEAWRQEVFAKGGDIYCASA